jgi:hypothetical protein
MGSWLSAVCWICLVVTPAIAGPSRGGLPWFMRETAMTPAGRLTFLDKPWWPQAKTLAEGQSFALDLNHDGRPDTVVERKDGNIIEAIDDSGKAQNILNEVDTAYVVSYHGTGVVDRMIVYTDNNDDGKADEVEIRYYQDGYLRFAWFGENYDNDGGLLFPIRNWNYDGDGFMSKYGGNVMIYINKYDPHTNRWAPFSECPFAYSDPSHRGRGQCVVRVSAAPPATNHGSDLDYANHYQYIWAPVLPSSPIDSVNIRLSYNIDKDSPPGPITKLHYNFGFTMVGAQAYHYPNMYYRNAGRRPPQTVVRIPLNKALSAALHYPAQETGFTWDEARSVDRWEGQFWIYERRLLYNTGGPTYRWNMRREYSPKPESERQLYYSNIDKRYHLLGASEGWLEVGHLVDNKKDLEIRYFDSSRKGYIDTWEVFVEGNPNPARVTRVLKGENPRVPLDPDFLTRDYYQRVIPESIAEDQLLIAEMKRFVAVPRAAAYESAATASTTAESRRYCLDVARELYFLQTRDALNSLNGAGDYPSLPQGGIHPDLSPGPMQGRFTVSDTLAFWKLSLQIHDFTVDYGEGRYEESCRDLKEIPVPSSPLSQSNEVRERFGVQ